MENNSGNEINGLAEAFAGQGNSTSSRRILQEYKNLLESKEFPSTSIEFENGHNIYIWKISINITNYSISNNLRRDFDVYSSHYSRQSEIVFEIRFPSSYPQDPPFLRLIRPRFAFQSGHVTIGGSICTEGLTKTGWVSSRPVENILVEFFVNLSLGDGSLDIRGSGYDYQLPEAMDAFRRAASAHNWQI